MLPLHSQPHRAHSTFCLLPHPIPTLTQNSLILPILLPQATATINISHPALTTEIQLPILFSSSYPFTPYPDLLTHAPSCITAHPSTILSQSFPLLQPSQPPSPYSYPPPPPILYTLITPHPHSIPPSPQPLSQDRSGRQGPSQDLQKGQLFLPGYFPKVCTLNCIIPLAYMTGKVSGLQEGMGKGMGPSQDLCKGHLAFLKPL